MMKWPKLLRDNILYSVEDSLYSFVRIIPVTVSRNLRNSDICCKIKSKANRLSVIVILDMTGDLTAAYTKQNVDYSANFQRAIRLNIHWLTINKNLSIYVILATICSRNYCGNYKIFRNYSSYEKEFNSIFLLNISI